MIKLYIISEGSDDLILIIVMIRHARSYYGVLKINLRPKTSNCFIKVAFFEKIPPVLVNK